MYQMRRYVGENIARQMDGDLVPYEDAILFATEQWNAAINAAIRIVDPPMIGEYPLCSGRDDPIDIALIKKVERLKKLKRE